MTIFSWILYALLAMQVAGLALWLYSKHPWIRFTGAQLVQVSWMIIGWFLLVPFCLAHAWTKPDRKSIKDSRMIDRWWLIDFVFGNKEDGSSGRQALIHGNEPYMPFTSNDPVMQWLYDAWRAYCWNARNSCDNLKYVFAWKDGPTAIEKPYRLLWIWNRTLKIGYQMENGFNVPVCSP